MGKGLPTGLHGCRSSPCMQICPVWSPPRSFPPPTAHVQRPPRTPEVWIGDAPSQQDEPASRFGKAGVPLHLLWADCEPPFILAPPTPGCLVLTGVPPHQDNLRVDPERTPSHMCHLVPRPSVGT